MGSNFPAYHPEAINPYAPLVPTRKKRGCGCGGGCGQQQLAQPITVQIDRVTQLILLAIAAGELLNFLKKR